MLSSVALFAFRNYIKQEVALHAGVNLFLGANAQGKTNLLEAIYVGCTGRSPRASVLAEMIMWEQAGARVVLHYHDQGEHAVQVRLERAPGTSRTRRTVAVDGKNATAQALFGRVPVVLFHPEEMTLLRGGGEPRRRVLNELLSQLRPGYAGALARYARILEQRNQLLKRIAEGTQPSASLPVWTEQLAAAGAALVDARRTALDQLAPVAASRYAAIAPGEELTVRYAPSVDDPGDVAAAIVEALDARRHEELARGLTVAGPHRDDVAFAINGVPAAVHASQGQQRSAILALKLAEIDVLGSAGSVPLLLLDDVMSELDAARRAHLVEAVEAAPQSVITAAEAGYFSPGFVARVGARRVAAGAVVDD